MDKSTVLSHDARSGAALFALDQILRADPPWLGCLRMRLALQAAVAGARLLRLSADEAALRDAEWLTRPGDDPGPAGRLHRHWRRFAGWPTRLAGEMADALDREIGATAAAGDGPPEVLALMRADAELAAALGWEMPLPLAATVIGDPLWREGRERRPFRVGGEGWETRRMAVFGLAAARAHALAVDLARRAESVATAADRLRTRDGGAGVRLILGDDCVAPWRMAQPEADRRGRGDTKGLGSDRAARRFCESLHAMGALRLLTDRPTFRLYGL
ncbi:DUF1403 family protein [Tabrizicola sp.]|uniref:DUF1403 family protein n=1 Tax=Tabrizicola sp. TaxID=2005166 RepID=UPI003F3329FF